MFVPITSEITIGTGTVLKEIATNNMFKVSRRLKDGKDVWGDDPGSCSKLWVAIRNGKQLGTSSSVENILQKLKRNHDSLHAAA